MKKLLFICCLLIVTKVFSQNFDSIKKRDTLYIYFKKNHVQKKIYIKEDDKKNVLYSPNGYYFYLPCEIKEGCYLFFHTGGSIKLDSNKIKPMDLKKVRKEFLIKNKDRIINMDFFIKYGQLKCLEIFKDENNSEKVIYIIDNDEIKKRKILLRQAKFSSTYPYEE